MEHLQCKLRIPYDCFELPVVTEKGKRKEEIKKEGYHKTSSLIKKEFNLGSQVAQSVR